MITHSAALYFTPAAEHMVLSGGRGRRLDTGNRPGSEAGAPCFRSGVALNPPEQALVTCGVDETGVPLVSDRLPVTGVQVRLPLGASTVDLIDAADIDRLRRATAHLICDGAGAIRHDRPT
ncbi:hypothetical protein [Actinacidiphila glaucinigra]|uniref:hypothetical protein n=1 Tax=Actinacidiphila glaucinigra TaxID=235986 RepID=UPI003713C4A5